jgi:hypothetical protein
MLVMTAGLAAAFLSAWLMPSHVSFADAVSLANVATGSTTRRRWTERPVQPRSGPSAAFLALGTSARTVAGPTYLSGRSIAESRRGLFFSPAAKIPMQLFILFIGAMVFVFYIYEKPPILFQPIDRGLLTEPGARDAFAPIERDYDEAFSERQAAADRC